MAKNYEIPFTKFHGLSNDFIVARGKGLPKSLPDLARSITDRHNGVGADGFITVLQPQSKNHDARIRFFNADGSEPEMSGNGIRCAAAYILGAKPSRHSVTIETIAGAKHLRLIKAGSGAWTFKVGMGMPILEPEVIPFQAGGFPAPVVRFPLQTQGGVLPVTVTSMGNPHCSTFVPDFASVDWMSLGAEIERNDRFPNRTNVEFVKVISKRKIEVRYWERGVGKTMSSGTGSCGAVVACILNGLTERKVRVHTLAGDLKVEWPEQGEVTLTGPVVRVARGNYSYHT